MRGIRWVFGLFVAVAAIWSVYWWVGERALQTATADWFVRMASEGRTASYSALAVEGYPSRFDMTVTEPRLADPATGTGYSAPFVQLVTLSYTPWHVILALPPEQRLTWDGGAATLRSAKMQASVVVKPQPSVPLERFTLVGSDLDLRADAGPALLVKTLRLAARALPGEADYELGLDLLETSPEGDLHDRIAQSGLPPAIDEIRVDAVARISAPLDRAAPETRPRIVSLDVKSASLRWGPVTLSASGTLTADAEGRAEGTLALVLEGWRAALDAMTKSDVIDARNAGSIIGAAGMMAKGKRLELPLTFAGGRTRLGIFPLGDAPRLR